VAAKQVLFADHHADIIGGGQLSLLDLMGHLDPRRYLPRLVCPGGGTLAAAARREGIEVDEVEMPSLRAPLAAASLWKIRRLVGQHGAALLHANSSRGMFYAGLAGRLAGVPAIWHVRIAAAEAWWDRLLAGMARRVVANSRATAGRFAGRAVEVIYNGEELEPFARADGRRFRQELGLGGGPVVGMVGRLTPEKDHETLLRAAALLAPRWPRARFLVVGEDPDPGQGRRAALESLAAELGVAGRVVFTGQRDDIPEVMAGLDALVHCAHQEAFGRVLVEAMAAGLPVVATAVGGIPEVVIDGQTGVLVAEGDPPAVAGAVEGLFRAPARRQALGRAGRERAVRCFSLEAHVERVQALYDQVLGA
jgi:glycosyltransferase involved in cell wall biosynthesis